MPTKTSVLIKICLLLLFLTGTTGFAVGQPGRLALSGGGLVQSGNLQWSIAGNQQGQFPNILSELKFHGIKSSGAYVQVAFKPIKQLQLVTYYSRSGTISGFGTDVDYQDDNRTNTTFNESFDSNRGKAEELRFGVYYTLIQRSKLDLSTGLTYFFENQLFHILNTGFENLNSTYNARFNGAELNLNLNYDLFAKLHFYGGINYGVNAYHAIADWNIIDLFQHPVSFRQRADGSAFRYTAGIAYLLSPTLSLTLNNTMTRRNTDKGKDTSYLTTGSIIATQFNGTKWNTWSTGLGVCYRL